MGSAIVARTSRFGRARHQRSATVPSSSAAVTDPFDFLRLAEALSRIRSAVGHDHDPTIGAFDERETLERVVRPAEETVQA